MEKEQLADLVRKMQEADDKKWEATRKKHGLAEVAMAEIIKYIKSISGNDESMAYVFTRIFGVAAVEKAARKIADRNRERGW